MKRKAEDTANGGSKRQATNANTAHQNFRSGLFAPETVDSYAGEYAKSTPYKHAVVSNLIDDPLLRSVRSEILDNIHFTPKETDIYKIHQSGDLANLDGLPESSLEKLPSLLQLRDALYGSEFRQWLSTVTGAGALSGKKTDMAVNVYVPGCHLLCHDDVIGSRRVSYILYLTDPDVPWEAEWGGALRLYPTEERKDKSGEIFKVPRARWSKAIPPAWNQVSFFAVQPGESFHDVEEVYHNCSNPCKDDDRRFRMAISGWFHIPQQGEEGFEPGLEEKLAEKSSLQQLQGKAEQFDEPQRDWFDPWTGTISPTPTNTAKNDVELTESELEFLLKFMTANYLTPDTVEELNEIFAEESMLQLSDFLNPKFAEPLRELLQSDKFSSWYNSDFRTSRPPHKHRYQYKIGFPTGIEPSEKSESAHPFHMLLNGLLLSMAFRKWLSLVTGLTLKKCTTIARRFRQGLDYELAQAYEGEDPQLEYCLCVTPTSGWSGQDESEEQNGDSNERVKPSEDVDEDNVGGYELYMAGDEDDADNGSDEGVEIPAKIQSSTGAGDRRNASQKKADPAVYKAAGDDEDDGILASYPPNWNTFNVVLRDQGTLRFVKYVSQSAPGDRWDFTGCMEVEPDDDISAGDEHDVGVRASR